MGSNWWRSYYSKEIEILYLYKNIGADGIKTGFLTVEKYSLACFCKERFLEELTAVGSGFDTKNKDQENLSKMINMGLFEILILSE